MNREEAVKARANENTIRELLRKPEWNPAKLSRQISEKITQEEYEFSEHFSLKEIPPEKSAKAIRDGLDKIAAGKSVGRDLHLRLEDFLNRFSKEIYNTYAKHYREAHMREYEPQSYYLQSAFGGTNEGSYERAKAVSGQYSLYRPHYLDFELDRVMVCALKIDADTAPMAAELHYKYAHELNSHEPYHYTLTGEYVALPNLGRDIINLSHKTRPGEEYSHTPTGNQFLYVDQVHNDPVGRVISLSGVGVSAIGHEPATAWPFVATKHNAGFPEPTVLSINDEAMPQALRRYLTRGVVKWRSDSF